MPARKPKPIDWSTPLQAQRHRKLVTVTLSDEERAALDKLASYGRGKSAVVGELVLTAARLPRCQGPGGDDEEPRKPCGRPAPHTVDPGVYGRNEWSACGEHAEAARQDGLTVHIGA